MLKWDEACAKLNDAKNKKEKKKYHGITNDVEYSNSCEKADVRVGKQSGIFQQFDANRNASIYFEIWCEHIKVSKIYLLVAFITVF